MGGVGEVLGKLFEQVGTKVPEMLRKTEAGSSVHDLAGSKDDFFRMGGEDGAAIGDLHKNYQFYKAQYTKHLDKPLNDLQEGLAKEPTFAGKFTNKSTLGDIHNELQNVNHPAKQLTGKLLGMNSDNAGKTLQEISIQNLAQSRVLASAQAFGPKMENVIPYIMKAYESGNPVSKNWADGVMNVLSNETHDTSSYMTYQGKVKASSVKTTIGRAFTAENKLRNYTGQTPLDMPDVSPTYSSPGVLERRVQNVLRTVQLPFVALKHLSTYGNLSSIPAPTIVKSMLSMSDKEFKNFLDTSNILAVTEHDMLHRDIQGRFGKVAEWTKSPTAGSIFYNSIHMPLFDTLRRFQLTLSAAVGYHSAQDWAAQSLQGNKRALLELKEMGIDPNEVLKQEGKLSEDQLRKAMFHFTNNRFFTDKSIERSLLSNSNPWLRSATMYHTFVNAQQRFIRRELEKMLKAGDYKSIAQFAGTIGILFPAVAPFLKSLEVFGRTASIAQASQSAQDDYDSLMMNKGFGDAASTYLDLLSHYGAFGVYTSYIAAAHGNRFAYALLGPTVGTATRLAEDTTNAITRSNQLGHHNFNPALRDILEDTVPIGGNIAAHQLFPTNKELSSQRPHRTHRPSRRLMEE